MTDETITLPDGVSMGEFEPIAYYDKHMDCIRVLTHDRSVTENRVNELFTIYECNHRAAGDPEYVGFTIKGVRHLFEQVGLSLDGVYRLSDLIDCLVKYRPGSTMSVMLKLIYQASPPTGDLEVDFKHAA